VGAGSLWPLGFVLEPSGKKFASKENPDNSPERQPAFIPDTSVGTSCT